MLSHTTRKNSVSLRSCSALSATYFSRSLGKRRRLLNTRSACCSSERRCAGSRPRRPRASRSCSVKAVPLLRSGSRSSATPRGVWRAAKRVPISGMHPPCRGRRSLLRANCSGRLQDGRPARNLALDQIGESLRRTTRLVRKHAAELQQALTRRIVVERLDERFIELRHDLLGCTLGREQCVPGAHLVIGESCFLGGGNVGQDRRALLRGNGIGLDGIPIDLLDQVDDLVAHVVDLSADEIVEGRTGAAIRSDDVFHAKLGGQQRTGRKRHRAHAAVSLPHFCRRVLYTRDELLQICRRKDLP